jgi:hypothetical protein
MPIKGFMMTIRIFALLLILLAIFPIVFGNVSQNNDYVQYPLPRFPEAGAADAASDAAANATDINLSGLYMANNQDRYFLKQINNTLWWVGINKNDSSITNVFNGQVGKNKITGQWVDFPLLKTNGTGNLVMDFSYNINDNVTISNISSSSGKEFPIDNLVKLKPESLLKPKYMVSIDSIRIDQTRSPTQDIVYSGISAKKDNEGPITATRFVGGVNDNSNITLNMGVGPLELDKENKYLTLSYMAIDKGSSRTTDTLLNLRETLSELLDPSYNITSFWDTPAIIHSLSPGLLPGGCNGLVFADKMVIPAQELENLTAKGKHTFEKFFEGYNSPPGCGPNSKYLVKLSIAHVE